MLESNYMVAEYVRQKVDLAPGSPGVYLFRDVTGCVIYVGKAANLRSRVRSYFGSKSGLSTKVLRLIEQVADVEYVLAGNEQEALVLEADLIRRYRPQYNARLKDDKSFPYLKIDLAQDWPWIAVTRRRLDDGAEYFGPYASARSMRQTLRTIRKMFRFRECTGPLPLDRKRACLNKDMGLCPGPCVGAVTREEYRQTIDRIIMFLQGRHKDVLDSLTQEMKQAAAALDFERAAVVRDRIRAVELVTEQYAAVTALRGDQDILALAQDGASALVGVLSVREGRVRERQVFPLTNAAELAPQEVLRSFVLDFYSTAASTPPLVMLQHPVSDARLIATWLSGRRGRPVTLLSPRSGVKRQLVNNLADGVARQLAATRFTSGGHGSREDALAELKQVLALPSVPRRIEGFDISTIQGAMPVGSMVVFEDGIPRPSEYRRFRIRGVTGQDDYAMLHEVLRRRLTRLAGNNQGTGRRWSAVPSLILIDGGRGQLAAALAARAESGTLEIPMVSLAKEFELVYVEGSRTPASLASGCQGLLLLQAVRDEAHRYAVSYHRQLRTTAGLASVLESVLGIGPRRRRTLLFAFGTLEALRAATASHISETGRIPLPVARALKERLAALETGERR